MNNETGVIYDPEQVEDLKKLGVDVAEKMTAIEDAALPGVRAMNRKQRRQWAREQRREDRKNAEVQR